MDNTARILAEMNVPNTRRNRLIVKTVMGATYATCYVPFKIYYTIKLRKAFDNIPEETAEFPQNPTIQI